MATRTASTEFFGAEGLPSVQETSPDPRTALLTAIAAVEEIRAYGGEPNEVECTLIAETRSAAWWTAVEQLGLPPSDEVRTFLEREHDRDAANGGPP